MMSFGLVFLRDWQTAGTTEHIRDQKSRRLLQRIFEYSPTFIAYVWRGFFLGERIVKNHDQEIVDTCDCKTIITGFFTIINFSMPFHASS